MKLCAKKLKSCAEKMQVLHSKATLNRPPRILHFENAKSVLKLKFCIKKYYILCSENAVVF